MIPKENTDQIKALLLRREAQGLRVPLAVRMLLIILGIVNMTATLVLADAKDSASMLDVLVFAILFAGLFVNLQLWFWIRKSLHIERMGFIGALFDAGLVIAMSALAQMAGAKDGLPVGYVFKTEMPIVVLTFVVINGLACRPRYPLIVGVGAMLALSFPMARMMMDPSTHWTTDRTLVYSGTSNDLAGVVTIVTMAPVIVAAVCFAAHAARQMIRAGIAQELEHARQQEAHLHVVMREKVAAIARLVAGISHEVNTPIGALKSGVDTQERILSRLEQAWEASENQSGGKKFFKVGKQSLGAMRSAAERISNLETSLRALSHLDEADFRKVDLHEELGNVLKAVQRSPGMDASINLEYGEVPPVYLAASEFNQALVSLLTFAFEGAGPTGKVSVQTRSDGEHIHIAITNDGQDLGPEKRASLFDVSLAPQGQRVAAGMELAAAQSVMQRHGGALTADAGPEGGTRFQILLPQTVPEPIPSQS